MGLKGYLVRYVYVRASQCDKNALLFMEWDGEGSAFTQGNQCPGFRKVGEQRTLSASVDSQLSLAQTNLCAKVEYFGVAYSGPLHGTEDSGTCQSQGW